MSKVLTPEQRENLTKLATYLEALPADYEHFEMGSWIGHAPDDVILNYALHNGGVGQCGTAACAVGHGPAAGILVPPELVYKFDGRPKVRWWEYSRRFIEDDGYLFEWMFGARWTLVDNTPHGAAARIRYVLDTGRAPPGFRGASDTNVRFLAEYAPYRAASEAPTHA